MHLSQPGDATTGTDNRPSWKSRHRATTKSFHGCQLRWRSIFRAVSEPADLGRQELRSAGADRVIDSITDPVPELERATGAAREAAPKGSSDVVFCFNMVHFGPAIVALWVCH
jgi:hypothetical protein